MDAQPPACLDGLGNNRPVIGERRLREHQESRYDKAAIEHVPIMQTGYASEIGRGSRLGKNTKFLPPMTVPHRFQTFPRQSRPYIRSEGNGLR